MLSGLCLLIILCFLPETARKIVSNGSIAPKGIHRNLISCLVKQSGQGRVIPQEKAVVFGLPNPLSCLRILFHKDTTLVLISNAIFYMNYNCLQASLSPLLRNLYGLDALQIGLCYLPYGVACALASFVVGV